MPLARGRYRWWLGVAAGVCLAGVALVIVISNLASPLRNSARRAWKAKAIARIEGRLADRQWQTTQVARLQEGAKGRALIGQWVGDEVLVMKNGDWIVCQNICRKEDARIADLFLGRGSDGRWYDSTFHFCRGKVVLMNEAQPESLAQFVAGYWLVPFDGRSDECLKTTWTVGQPYGDELVQTAAAPVSGHR